MTRRARETAAGQCRSRLGYRSVAASCLVVAFAALQPLHAQERLLVSGAVLGTTGNPIPDVRVHATGAGVDTTVRTNALGVFHVVVPLGVLQVRATLIGYEPSDITVNVTGPEVRLDVTMRALAPQLEAVTARANWIGIRGVVGDDSTMVPLSDVTIWSMSRDIDVVTDGAGRFSFPLPKSERTTIRLEREGYLTRPAMVLMKGNSEDVVLLMRRGVDSKYTASALVDLSHRMSWGGIGMFVIEGEQMLRRPGDGTLWDGIRNSGMLIQKGIFLTHLCVFVNGMPQPFLHPRAIRLSRVDFVEVWGYNREATKTLSSRWPGASCSGGRPGRRGDGPWIAVWLRN